MSWRRKSCRTRAAASSATEPAIQHPHLTREKLPAIQKFPASDTRWWSRLIFLQVPCGLKRQDVRGTPLASHVEWMCWHGPCPALGERWEKLARESLKLLSREPSAVWDLGSGRELYCDSGGVWPWSRLFAMIPTVSRKIGIRERLFRPRLPARVVSGR